MSLMKRTLVLLAGLSLAGVALPQKKDAPANPPPANPPSPTAPSVAEPPRQAASTHVSLGDLVGADVMIEAGAAERPSGGAEKLSGGRSDSAEAPKGKVAELVLSTRDGQIACAALSVGKILGTNERIVLVPMTAVKLTTVDKRPGYVLHMTKGEIEALPPFDVRKAEVEGLDRAVEQARGLGSGAAKLKGKEGGEDDDAGMGPGKAREAAGKSAAPMSAAPSYVLSGQLKGCDVSASDKEFGKVQDAAVEIGGNAVGYVLVSRGGIASAGTTLYLVPFRSCQWTRAEEKNALKLAKTIDQLKTAPEYKRPVQGFVTPEQMKSADSFFGSEKGAAPNPQ